MRTDHDDRDTKPTRSRSDDFTPTGERDEREPEPRDLRERAHKTSPAAASPAAASPAAMTGTGSWQDIKSRFVDDPAGAIAAAEQLVQKAVDDKIRTLKDEATALCAREREEGEGEASTENMRSRLLRCQAYCERLGARSQ